MTSEDDREIGHFKTGRYHTLLRSTQERLIERLEAAECMLEEYREVCRRLLEGDTTKREG